MIQLSRDAYVFAGHGVHDDLATNPTEQGRGLEGQCPCPAMRRVGRRGPIIPSEEVVGTVGDS